VEPLELGNHVQLGRLKEPAKRRGQWHWRYRALRVQDCGSAGAQDDCCQGRKIHGRQRSALADGAPP
jgi:hypothetical protein